MDSKFTSLPEAVGFFSSLSWIHGLGTTDRNATLVFVS